MKKVIDRGKRSKTWSEVKPVKNISKYPKNFVYHYLISFWERPLLNLVKFSVSEGFLTFVCCFLGLWT